MCQDKTHPHSHDHVEAPAGSVHGHVILKLLSDEPLSKVALQAWVEGKYGASAQFHTCDTQGLSLDALLALLAERGKISRVGDGWRSDMSKVCSDA